MSIWDEWKLAREMEAPIFFMHRISGGKSEENKCGKCTFFATKKKKNLFGDFYTACSCTRYASRSARWDKNYSACGFFEKRSKVLRKSSGQYR